MEDKVRKTKRFTARTYESPLFNSILEDTLHPGGLKLTARMAEVAKIDEGSRVLDIACGKGTTACFLSQHYGCQVVGIDLSSKSISLARSKAEAGKLLAKVDFLLGDGESLPYKDSVFDTVISECSFSLLPDKEIAATEIERVLKPGGKLVIADIVLRGQISEELRTRATFASCIAGAKTLEGYIKLLEGVGFKGPYSEDQSEELKRVAYQTLISYGSWEAFSVQAIEGPATHSKDDSDYASGRLWQRLFEEGRPGYALLAVSKPRE